MRYLTKISFILLFVLLIQHFSGRQVQAQEVYFSISGKTVTFESGDRIGQYDFWFRPKPGVENPRPANVEIFDAGLGGMADAILRSPNTRTRYALHHFSELFELGERTVTPLELEQQPQELESITAFTENRFLNRWVTFFRLEEPRADGFIMRVSTDDGNDVNDFRIRISGEGAEDWQLITFNLSVGLIDSNPDNRFQFRPLFNDHPVPRFSLAGEEDTQVLIMDAFGETRQVRRGWEDFETQRYGKDNYWGIMMTGSRMRINNRVLSGTDEIVPFYFDPVVLNISETEDPTVRQIPGRTCSEIIMETETRSFYLNAQRAEWQVNDLQFTGNRITHDFREFNSYPYTLLVPTRGLHVPGFVVAEGEILVNAPPVAVLNDFPRVISPGQTITIDASESYDPEGRNLRYQWLVNGAFRGSSHRLFFSSSVSGFYEVTLVLDDNQPNANCTQTTETIQIRVNTQPYAEITYNNVIAKNVANTVSVINDEDADGDPLHFRWQVDGQEEIQTGRSATVQHSVAGNYTIRLTADDQTGTRNATYETTATYKVNAAPVPQFSLVDIAAPGQPVVLDGRPSSDPDSDPLTYRWELSDERVYEGAEHTIDFDTPGLYTIKLIVDDGENVENSVQELSRQIRINEAPVPNLTAVEHTNTPIVPFSGEESTDADQHIVSWEWDFGDGNTGSGETITHTYDNFGTYTVRLTVDDGMNVPNSVQYTEQIVVVNKNPEAEILAPDIVAVNQEFTLDGSNSHDPDGEVNSWTWFVNDTETGTGEQIAHTFEHPGVYSVSLKVRDDTPFEGAYGLQTHIIRVNHPPVPKWSSIPVVTEPGRTTVFDASESYDNDNEQLSYRWEFNDGTELEGERVERSFDRSGTYYFTLYADDGEGLANSIVAKEGNIRVNLSPIIVTQTQIRTNNKEVFLDASESYDPDGAQLRYTWILPDGTTRRESAFTWRAPERGVHEISLQVDDMEGLDNSVSSERIVILINRPPVAVVDARIESCTDQLIIFSSARSFDPDGDSFTTHWDFGDGTTSNEANPVHAFENPGLYIVRITLDDGFADTPTIQEIPVVIEGSPVAHVAESQMTVCANTPVVFDGSGSTDPNGMVGSFSWEFGDGNTAVGQKTTHLFTRPGTYRVALTITGSGTGRCPNVSQALAMVTVVEAPTAYFEVPPVVSPGTEITLDASDSQSGDTITKIDWYIKKDGEKFSELSGELKSFTPEIPGTYEITLTITTDNEVGCSLNAITRVIHVNRAPEIAWNLPDRWPQNVPFRLSADGTVDHDGFIDSYTWLMNGDEIGSGITNPLPVDEFGIFDVELVIRDNSGVENSEVRTSGKVLINPAPEPDFALPDTIYKGEQFRLRPAITQDEAGNTLSTKWLVNGEKIIETTHTATDPLYSITLIQDDNLELPNSEASAQRVLRVIQPVPPAPVLPDAIIATRGLSRDEMKLPDDIVILRGNNVVEQWQPRAAGEGSITLGWQPRNEVLERFEFTLPVFAPLSSEVREIREQVIYNPVNNRVELRAPQVNRQEQEAVIYRWVNPENGAVLSIGRIAYLHLTKGENRFELVITDEDRILGAPELRIPVIIFAE